MDETKMQKNVPKIEKYEKRHTKDLLNELLKTSSSSLPQIVDEEKLPTIKSKETLRLTKDASDQANKKIENVESTVKRTSSTQVSALQHGFQEQKKRFR